MLDWLHYFFYSLASVSPLIVCRHVRKNARSETALQTIQLKTQKD